MNIKRDCFTVTQLANRLGVSEKTLYRQRKTGDGPKWFKVGAGKNCTVYYVRSEVLKWEKKKSNGQ